jgi:hypothetical protein
MPTVARSISTRQPPPRARSIDWTTPLNDTALAVQRKQRDRRLFTQGYSAALSINVVPDVAHTHLHRPRPMSMELGTRGDDGAQRWRPSDFKPADAKSLLAWHGGHIPYFVCASAGLNLSIERCDQAPLPKTREDEVSNDFDATARHHWAMAQRVGMQIAELPINVRDRALAGTETSLREAGSELGIAGQQLESLVDLQMKAIRRVVADLDDSETPRHESI